LAFLGVTAVGFVILAAADSVRTLTVACLCIGMGQGGTNGPLMALLGDLVPDAEMGRAVGTNNVLGDVGGAIGPLLTLPLVDVVGFPPIYLACAAMPIAAAVILLVGVRRETGRFRPSVGV